MRGQLICAKRAGLKRREPRRCALEGDIGNRFSLEHLPHKNNFVAFFVKADAVGDHAFAQHGRKFRSKVADLIGMRKQNQIRLGGGDDLGKRDAVTIGRVRFQQVVLYQQDFGDIFCRQFFGKICDIFSKDHRADATAGIRSNLLRGHQGFKAGVVPLALALLGDNQNFHFYALDLETFAEPR